MSSKTRHNLIKSANLLEKVATMLVDVLSISLVMLANTLVFAIELLITGKAKRPKAPKYTLRVAAPRKAVEKTIIYRQVVPRAMMAGIGCSASSKDILDQ